MIRALVNGIERDTVDVGERGLQYGDGVFRTLLLHEGRLLDSDRQMERLLADAARIGLPAPSANLLHDESARICAGQRRAVLKIILTAGESARGYRRAEMQVTRILTLHPPPDLPIRYWHDGITARICTTRLARSPVLAGVKHLNRLEQVLARAEWRDEDVAEGLMLDTQGQLIGGVSTNLFFARDGLLMTPDLSHCGVAGVTRDLLLEAAPAYTRAVRIGEFTVDDLRAADECFVCNSVVRIWPVTRLADKTWEVGELTRALQMKFANPWLRAG